LPKHIATSLNNTSHHITSNSNSSTIMSTPTAATLAAPSDDGLNADSSIDLSAAPPPPDNGGEVDVDNIIERLLEGSSIDALITDS
jgi:hypothetical protein